MVFLRTRDYCLMSSHLNYNVINKLIITQARHTILLDNNFD